MTENRWLLDVERIVLRDSTVSRERVDRIMEGVRRRLSSAGLPAEASAAADPVVTIPRISVRTDDDESITRVLSDAVLKALRGVGGETDD